MALAQLLDHQVEVTTENSKLVVAIGEVDRHIQVPISEARHLILKVHHNEPPFTGEDRVAATHA